MSFLFGFISILCEILTIVIIVRVIFSWFTLDTRNPAYLILYQLTEPILAPLRRIVPRLGMFDISPLIAIIILQLVAGILR